MITVNYPNGHVKEFPFSGDFSEIPVEPAGINGKITVKTSFSLKDVIGAWYPTETPGQARCHLFYGIKLVCGANMHFPYVGLFNVDGINRGTFYSTDLYDDTEIVFNINQAAATYDVVCTIAATEKTAPFKIIIDNRKKNWQEILKDYRNSLVPSPPDYPAAAYDPVYCTWYSAHAAITQDLVEKHAGNSLALPAADDIIPAAGSALIN